MRCVPGNSTWGGPEGRIAWHFGEKKEGQRGCRLAIPQGVRAGRRAGAWGVVIGSLSFILHAGGSY